MTEHIDADVCVVGAGYAGLTAARRLAQGGKSVVVLEARDRVGGRVWSEQRSSGVTVDRGAGWLAPKHDAIRALAQEVGVGTYKTYVAGNHLLVGGGRTRTYKGLIPRISPLAVLAIARAQMTIDRMAKTVPVDAPWNAKDAAKWDATSVAQWIEGRRIRNDVAHDLFEMAVRGLMTGDLEETSLLHLLLLVRSAGSINTLFSIEKGYQENLFDGGAGETAKRVAAELGDAVRLNAPVRSITQSDDRVTVASRDVTVDARAAVVSTPPALTLEIEFDPPLDHDRRTLYGRAIGGPETKTLAVYDEPFWRGDGFSGQSADAHSAAEVTIDSSPASGSPGVLAVFTFGAVAAEMAKLDEGERRRQVLERLGARFGPRASSPIDFVETEWWTEEWTRGCSMYHFPQNTLTRYGHLLREPFGRIHWAGTETATVSHGAMDGAVRSGDRAAAEILG